MKQYLALGQDIYNHGNTRGDRTGTGTRSLFGRQYIVDLREGFPLLTTKQMEVEKIVIEHLWMLSGSTNNNDLRRQGVNIWNKWALPNEIPMTFRERVIELEKIEECSFDLKYRCEEEYYLSERWVKAVFPDGESSHIEYDDEIKTIGQLLDHMGVPKTKPNPRAGDLGPIYGEQWRAWPSHEHEIAPLAIEKRIAMVTNPVLRKNFEDDYASLADMPEEIRDARMAQLGVLLTGAEGIPNVEYQPKLIDQFAELMKGLKERPYSRRHIVTAWNPALLPDETISPQENVRNGRMCLASCQTLFQMYVEDIPDYTRWQMLNEKCLSQGRDLPQSLGDAAGRQVLYTQEEIPQYYLSTKLYQRSADYCAGVPWNLAGYALITHMVAHCLNMVPKEFIHSFGDAHIYNDHLSEFERQLKESPMRLCKIEINPNVRDIFSFKPEDIRFVNYHHNGKKFKYPTSV